MEEINDGNFGHENSFHSFASQFLVIMEPKERILIKSNELFTRFGIKSVSMDDIANNLGMSKKTVYQYFADKDELVHAVVDMHMTDMQSDCMGCQQDAENAIHEVFLTLDRLMDDFNNMNPMLLHDMEKFHFKSFQRFREYKDKFLAEYLTRNIEWGIKDELFRPEINIDVITKFRLESMFVPFNVSAFPPAKYNLANTTEEVLLHFIYGLATVKGHKLIQNYNQQRLNKVSYDEIKK